MKKKPFLRDGIGEQVINGNVPRKNAEGQNTAGTTRVDMFGQTRELIARQIELEVHNELLSLTQEGLEAGREKFFSFYNLAPVGFFTMNSEGRVFEANLTSTRMLGIEENSLDGMDFTDVISPGHPDIFEQFLKQLLLTGLSQSCELKLTGRGKTTFWARLEAVVITGATEGSPPYLVVMSDIEESKSKDEKYRLLFDNAQDAVAIFDSETRRFVDANDAFLKLYGYERSELTALAVDETSAEPEKTNEVIREVLDNGADVRVAVRWHKKKNGARFPVELASGPFSWKGRKMVFGVIRDITERVEAVEKLNIAKRNADEANLLKDKFVSLVVHDVRSPMGTVIGLQKMIVSKHKEPGCNECRGLLEKSVACCETMVEMTENILESSTLKIGSVQLKRAFCDMRNLCGMVMDDLRLQADNKQIALKNELPHDMRLYVDKALIRRVIHNLVLNAIKFTNKGGEVTAFRPDGRNILAIKDTGVGISENALRDLFKYEVRTSTFGTSGERGTGFGLPLCMDIVKAHGGMIKVSSEKNKGSVFYVDIAYAKPLVLVVCEEDTTSIIRGFLENMESEVIMVQETAEVLDSIRKKPPTLIIADYATRLKDGFALLQDLRGSAEFSKIPVLFVTKGGQDDIETRKKAFEFGASDFLTKPLSEVDLIPRVGRFIGA